LGNHRHTRQEAEDSKAACPLCLVIDLHGDVIEVDVPPKIVVKLNKIRAGSQVGRGQEADFPGVARQLLLGRLGGLE
jgi:hypothetical protein